MRNLATLESIHVFFFFFYLGQSKMAVHEYASFQVVFFVSFRDVALIFA